MLQHGVEGSASESKRPGDAFSESGLLDVRDRRVASWFLQAGLVVAADVRSGLICPLSLFFRVFVCALSLPAPKRSCVSI